MEKLRELLLSHLSNWKPVSWDTNSCLVSFSSKSLCKEKVKERYFREAEKSEIFLGVMNCPLPQLMPIVTGFARALHWFPTTEFVVYWCSGTRCAGGCEGYSSSGILNNSVT